MRTTESLIQVKLSFVSNWEGAVKRIKKRNGGEKEKEASGGRKDKSDLAWCPEKFYTFTFGDSFTLELKKNADRLPSIILLIRYSL